MPVGVMGRWDDRMRSRLVDRVGGHSLWISDIIIDAVEGIIAREKK
jgi:hypothetical protein